MLRCDVDNNIDIFMVESVGWRVIAITILCVGTYLYTIYYTVSTKIVNKNKLT